MKNYLNEVTEEEILNYLKANPIHLSDYAKSKGDITFQVFERDENKITASIYDVQYTFTNFNMTTNKKIFLIPHYEKSWLRFMYKKFGNEYKQAFIDYRDELKRKNNESYDFLTEEYVNDLQHDL